jgi:hypothetical protein
MSTRTYTNQKTWVSNPLSRRISKEAGWEVQWNSNAKFEKDSYDIRRANYKMPKRADTTVFWRVPSF